MPCGVMSGHGLSVALNLLMRALVRHFGRRAAVGHHSRLVTLQLPTWRADLGVGHLVGVADRGCRSRRGYRVHPAVTGLHLILTAHNLATPVAAAIVQTGLLNGSMDALIAADAALFRELTDHDELEAAVDLFAGHSPLRPGSARPWARSASTPCSTTTRSSSSSTVGSGMRPAATSTARKPL